MTYTSCAKVTAPSKPGEAVFPVMVVVDEADAEFIGEDALLDAAGHHVDVFFKEELLEFGRVGIVDDDRAFSSSIPLMSSYSSFLPVWVPVRTISIPSSLSCRIMATAL